MYDKLKYLMYKKKLMCKNYVYLNFNMLIKLIKLELKFLKIQFFLKFI